MKPIRYILTVIGILVLLSATTHVFSQCSVCRVSAESHINNQENKIGRGLNKGILYLMAVPYMMGGVAFFILYKHRKRTA